MLYAILFNIATGATTVSAPYASLEACSHAMFERVAKAHEAGQPVQGTCLPARETLLKLSWCVVVERTPGGEIHAMCGTVN